MQRRLAIRRGVLGVPMLLALALCAAAVGCTQPPASWYAPRSGDSKPLIGAHQFGEGQRPSNVAIASDHAVAAGADFLDTDTFVSASDDGTPANGEPVLFHDEELQHRTNGSGPIVNKTLAELRQLDFAYKWTTDGGATYPYRGQGITVMTLRELLTRYQATHPHMRFGVEIKQIPVAAVAKICQVIKDTHKENLVLVSSNDQPNMDAFRAACPTVATSATFNEVVAFWTAAQTGTAPAAIINPPYSSLQVPETQVVGGVPFTILNQQFVDQAHAHPKGLKVIAWTIDTPEQACKFAGYGVDGINANNPTHFNPQGVYPDMLADGRACPLPLPATTTTTTVVNSQFARAA